MSLAFRRPPDLPVPVLTPQEKSALINNDFQRKLAAPTQRAFPHNQDTPALALKFRNIALISGLVCIDLFNPEVLPGSRNLKEIAVMAMPEAPMSKYYASVLWENKIGRSWQARDVETVAKPATM
ncbi:MAG: hypothetical protein V2I43_02255 [Parvularcula sp.]|jgi:hypothetical protein|nr:hypothetical protein [Parvularcula sp.]